MTQQRIPNAYDKTALRLEVGSFSVLNIALNSLKLVLLFFGGRMGGF